MVRRRAIKNVARDVLGEEEIISPTPETPPPKVTPTPTPVKPPVETPITMSMFIPSEQIPTGLRDVAVGDEVKLSIRARVSSVDEAGINLEIIEVS